MTDKTGYHNSLKSQVESAPSDLLGVRLGRLCIKEGVPVMQVANTLHLSRTTLYSWFKGETLVPPKHSQQVLDFMDSINKE